jgi:glycosyltransferase involved in cell wall biosynthesis
MPGSLRTLFITAGCPYPPASGTPLRTWQHLSLAAELGPAALLSLGPRPPGLESIPGLERWRHIEVTADPQAAAHGVPLLWIEPAIQTEIERFQAEVAPSVTVFSNIWLDPMPGRAQPSRLVYDAHNVYSALAAELGKDAGQAERIERTIASAAAEIWVCSEADERRMRPICPASTPIRVIPNGIDADAYAGLRSGRIRRARRAAPTLAFVGSFWYAPNAHAAEALIDRMLPLVRAAVSPDVRLLLVGAAPTHAMLAAAACDPGILVPGRVPDVRPYLGLCDIVVVPLEHGSGTRLKVLEAFAAGKPVVATAKAVEGLVVRDGEHLLIAEDPAAFAGAVARLLREPELGEALTRAAFALLEERYAWPALRGILTDGLAANADGVAGGSYA